MPQTVLVVEDRADRVAWFRARYADATVHVTDDPKEAIRVLGQEPVDLLCLDQDLGREPENGRDVSLWLITHPEILPHLEIITHTVNVVSGPAIEQELMAAGRLCVWRMFGFEPGQAEVLKADRQAPDNTEAP